MTQQDRKKWNRRYSERDNVPRVHPIVQRFHTVAHRGRALDLAAGRGANSHYLAHKGFTVFAVDISDLALAAMARCHSALHPVCLDLDIWDIPPNHFDLIINIRYLNRRLFPQIITGLKPNGVFIAETYLNLNAVNQPNGPACRDYLLQPNELLHAFLSLHLIYYHEDLQTKEGERGCKASLVAIKHPHCKY